MTDDDLDLIGSALGLEPYQGSNNRTIREAEAALARLRAALAAAEKERDEARARLIPEEERRKLTGDALHAEGVLRAVEVSRDQMGAALREAREWVKQAGYSALGARNLLIRIDALLVDSAEDALKTPSDPATAPPPPGGARR